MARMLGKRLTHLSPKQAMIRLTERQVQMIADGIVEGRKIVPPTEKDYDEYDSDAMDIFEQLERYGFHFPDLVLGGEDFQQWEHEKRELMQTLREIKNCFRCLQAESTSSRAQKFCEMGMQYVDKANMLLFGQPEK